MLNNSRNLSVLCFRGLFQSVRARTTCLSASRAYVFQRICAHPGAVPEECTALSFSNPIKECVRHKSSDKEKGSGRREYESDSDDEEEEMNVDEEGRSVMKRAGLHSLRLDHIVMRVFSLSRRKTEELILSNHVHINGSVAIKSYEVKMNDVLELKEINPSFVLRNMNSTKFEVVKIKPDCSTKTYQLFFVSL